MSPDTQLPSHQKTVIQPQNKPEMDGNDIVYKKGQEIHDYLR